MMIEEVKVLSKLETRDQESFVERSHFFTKNVIVNILEDYVDKLKKYVDNLPQKKCKGVPYVRIKGQNIFVEDVDKKIYRSVRDRIWGVKRAHDYYQIHKELVTFMRCNFVNLPYDTPKSKVWIDAYKGEGAYYTLKNLIMFHNCDIEIGREFGHVYKVSGVDAMQLLNQKLDEYQDEGWRMFALMKKVIQDNNFSFEARMEELGVY
jgi:hypothetical protein